MTTYDIDYKSELDKFKVSKGSLMFNGHSPFYSEESKAMSISIAKWITIVNHYSTSKKRIGDGAMSTCGLCMLFYNIDCVGCPIAIKSDDTYCDGTPYNHYCNANISRDTKEMLKAAVDELSFLCDIAGIPYPAEAITKPDQVE
jgi:hypothetical protein